MTARGDLLALVASTPKGGATVAGDPNVTLAIAMRLDLDPADLALVIDVAAAAVSWAHYPDGHVTPDDPAEAAVGDAILAAVDALTPGALALATRGK